MGLNRIVSHLDEDLIAAVATYQQQQQLDSFDKAQAELIRLGLSSGTAVPALSDAVVAEIAEFAAGNGISYDLALAHVVANGLANIEEANTL